ncbi:MAG: transporter [Muribaculaceae bacterium]|nr:transporter [Muribaculaceae bacterium]
MNIAHFRQMIKPWMLPIAMVIGMIFHSAIESVQFLAPYLIFIMLLITFCKVNPRDLKFGRLSWILLGVQLLGGVGVYFALRPVSAALAEGAFICVFCPTATAAPVITGMLGGSVTRVAMYSIISNVAVALTAPVLFEYMGGESLTGGVSFVEGFATICAKVGPLIILPLLTAFLLKALAPKVHHAVATHQSLSFYIWAISLIIVVGKSVSFVMSEPSGAVPMMIAIAVAALVVCVIQFIVGRKIGRRFGDPVAGAQGLAQKNTVLAIWMALNFLSPISSVGPASYILWQNTINSAQIYFKTRRDSRQ